MSFLCSGILTTLDNSLYLSAGPGSCLCTSLAFAYEPVVSVLPGLILHPLSHEWELWRGGTLCETSEVLDGTKDTTLKRTNDDRVHTLFIYSAAITESLWCAKYTKRADERNNFKECMHMHTV